MAPRTGAVDEVKRVTIAMLLVVLVACSRDSVDRTRWQKMSPHDKTLYVRSLLGAEKAASAKGGSGRTFPQPAETYVVQIDEAYARGESRNVPEVFGAMAEGTDRR
jgi:hypothetical protein